MASRILFLLNQPPYRSSHALETLEAVLVAGVFELDVSVLFKNTALFQLLDGQDGARLGQRTHANVLSALPEYGIDKLYVCRRSAMELGLGQNDFCLPVVLLSANEQKPLLAEQHAVISG